MLLALATSLLLVGCGAANPVPTPSSPAAQAPATAGAAQSLPAWIDVPSIGARSSLIPLGLNPDKTIEVPPVSQPKQAGWYKYSPPPGQTGPAVVLGHIDGDHQEGIFWRLRDVKVGDKVLVGRQDGSTLTFAVTRIDQIAKSDFPTSAVYGNTTDPELRLITCGGAFDAATHNYRDNVIVYATLAS